ncbi:MAG: glycoside hydrolase family 3 protein [Proteobacteria bacterium]|nr:glycoside hydrolase family 3 protein [Pseudomonadota bacterium]
MNSRPAKFAGYCMSLWMAFGAVAAEAPQPVIHPQRWPELPPALPRDEALEAHVEELLARMSPEQKVGQLIQADIGSITPNDLRHYPLGSILNGGNSAPGDDKLTAPSEWLALADRFYEASIGGAGATVIPALWGTDAVHGHNNIPGATIFPHNIGLGAARDPELIRRIGEITALEVRVTGLDWAFSPTVAVARDARWGRTYESYSENPDVVRQYAVAMVTGLQGAPGTPQFLDAAHVLATPKHFLGDGGTGGKDQGDNLYTEKQLLELDSLGYQAAILAGAQTVMASYSSWRGQKMHGNHALLTDVLKGRFGFEGLVIGDWNGHAQLPGCSATRCAAALNAGIDMFMAPDGWRELLKNTLDQVNAGEIGAARLDDAVRRVLRVKLRAHLDTEGRPSSRPYAGRYELLGSAEHRAVARQAVRESLVLLKNANHLLPLSPAAHVLVAGDGADSIAKQSGGWTIDWQGTEPNQDFPHGESIYAGIARCVSAAGGTPNLSPAGEFSTRPDVAIVVFGESPYAEYAGDVHTLEYSPGDKRDLALLRRLHALDIPVVAVFLSGRPLWVNAELNAADSFVAAWLPGPEGGGVADVLFRAHDGTVQYDFRGTLPFSWPSSPRPPAVDELPGEEPLFGVGYGLTYADDGYLKRLPEVDVPPALPPAPARKRSRGRN